MGRKKQEEEPLSQEQMEYIDLQLDRVRREWCVSAIMEYNKDIKLAVLLQWANTFSNFIDADGDEVEEDFRKSCVLNYMETKNWTDQRNAGFLQSIYDFVNEGKFE